LIEAEKEVLQLRTDDLLQQKEVLLAEMQHRIVNSLQIIASILMLKARAVTSEETVSICRTPIARHVGRRRSTASSCLGRADSVEIALISRSFAIRSRNP